MILPCWKSQILEYLPNSSSLKYELALKILRHCNWQLLFPHPTLQSWYIIPVCLNLWTAFNSYTLMCIFEIKLLLHDFSHFSSCRGRGVATGIVASLFYMGIFFGVKSYPTLLENIGLDGIFYVYAAVSIGGIFYTWLVLPSTEGKFLCEIETETTQVTHNGKKVDIWSVYDTTLYCWMPMKMRTPYGAVVQWAGEGGAFFALI